MTSDHRVAQPGDILFLLTPAARELQRLRSHQIKLQARYGGKIFEHIHITCQRVSLDGEHTTFEFIEQLDKRVKSLKTFPLFADNIIQFYAPFWQTQMLRWRIQDTDPWMKFKYDLRDILSAMNSPSHYDRIRRATCTALVLDSDVNMDLSEMLPTFPLHLFMASQIEISRINKQNDFEYLGTVELDNAGSHIY
jgi:hypothetical protein